MDLVFIIDGSKSLGPVNFELVKGFVNAVVDSLDVSRNGTRVGLLQYSTKVRTEFTLGRYTSARDVKEAVSRVQYMGRGSMTGMALRHMFQTSFTAMEGARLGVRRVTIVLTDGRSQDDVVEWANKAKNAGTALSVGAGCLFQTYVGICMSCVFDLIMSMFENFKRNTVLKLTLYVARI